MNTRISAMLIALTLTLTATMAAAQGGYPSQPIKLLVGFPPGGSTDILARALANEVRTALNQEVVVITRAGASGAISVGEVVAAVKACNDVLCSDCIPCARLRRSRAKLSELSVAASRLREALRQKASLTKKESGGLRAASWSARSTI